MAVIGAIRKRTGLLIAFIAVALLMFLLMDALSSNSRIGSASGQNIGKINGSKIDYVTYQMALSDYEERITTLFPQAEIEAANRAQFREEIWNRYAMEAILGGHFQDLGLNITADELGNSMWGDNIHFFAQNVLVNPQTGQFDPAFARQYVISADQNEEARIRVRHLENIIEEDRIRTKYAALYTKGIYVPDFMAGDAREARQSSADISYVFFPYADVADSEISYSDKDLQKYITDHPERFKRDASREVQFYAIDILPSAEDTANARQNMAGLITEMQASDNDSLFVKRHSDIPYTGRYFTEMELFGDPNLEAYFIEEPGSYYGPFFQEGAFRGTKLIDRKNIPDSVSARHILLVPQSFNELDSLRALADSLVDFLKEFPDDFAVLAAVHSKDQSNAAIGGDLGFFKPGDMVTAFNDAAFYRYEEGDIYQVDSRFGIHIVRIDASNPVTPAVQLAILSQQLEYSKDTERELFRAANRFRTEFNTLEKFRTANENYPIQTAEVTQNQVAVLGITDARDLVRWSFQEKVGSVNFFDVSDKYLVACITGETEEGLASLAAVQVEVEQEVKKERKASALASRVEAFGAGNIQELASKSGLEVKSQRSLSFSAISLQGGGNETDVVAYAFGMTPGSMSGPLKGVNGIYVIQLNNLERPDASGATDLFSEKAQLRPNVTFQALLEDLKGLTDVSDKRYLFY